MRCFALVLMLLVIDRSDAHPVRSSAAPDAPAPSHNPRKWPDLSGKWNGNGSHLTIHQHGPYITLFNDRCIGYGQIHKDGYVVVFWEWPHGSLYAVSVYQLTPGNHAMEGQLAELCNDWREIRDGALNAEWIEKTWLRR